MAAGHIRAPLAVWGFSMHGLLLLVALLPAHPVPKDNHDRTVVVRLTPKAVVIEYRLEVDETTGAKDLPRSETSRLASRKELHAAFSRYLADVIADNLLVKLDGTSVRLRCAHRSEKFITDHLRCDYRFEGDWNLTPGKEQHFYFRECNWEDDEGKIALDLTGDSRLSPRADVPSRELIARPSADRKPGDGERLRVAKATFQLAPGESRALYKPALPPDLVLPALPEYPEDGAAAKPASELTAAEDKPQGPTAPGAAAKPEDKLQEPTSPDTPEESSEADLPPPDNLLTLMLDSRLGVGMVLLLALLFGAAHALTPGHGKTLVAAYLVGERGTIWHALLLGLVTTLTHTFVVIVLAALLPLFIPNAVPATVQSVLGLVGGLLIAGLGFWLLLRRLTGQADHIHIGGDHHHHHHGPGHDHVHLPLPEDGKSVGWWGLVTLGITGGIVPCWDAIAMLGLAISAQQLWLALPLLLAFSAGLASVLIALGIGVVCARNWAGQWWGESRRFQTLVRILPLFSAVLVTGLGLWLCYGSVQMTHPH